GARAHAAVLQVAHVAGEAEALCTTLRKVAIADALYAPFDDDVRRGSPSHEVGPGSRRPSAGRRHRPADAQTRGRGERIRTSDFTVPNRARYQDALRPE